MKRQPRIALAVALFTLASASALAQNGSPPGPPADLAQQVKAAQERAFKQEYGFTDKQIALYRKKDAAIAESYNKKIDALTKQVAKSPAPKKRELYRQIGVLEKQREAARNKSLLSVATPPQQARIKAQYKKQGVVL